MILYKKLMWIWLTAATSVLALPSPQSKLAALPEGSVDPSIHLLLPDNLLDSFGCLFGCSGGQFGGQAGDTESATIQAPIEVSGLDIVKPEDLNIPGFNLEDFTGKSCGQAGGCGGSALAAIPHPESGPVVVLLGEDVETNTSQIVVLGDESDQATLQQSGLMAGILKQLFQDDPASVLSYDVPRIGLGPGAAHIQSDTQATIEEQLFDVPKIDQIEEQENKEEVNVNDNKEEEQEQADRQPRKQTGF